jgi:hypothetical protein
MRRSLAPYNIRHYCHEYERKFSIRIIESQQAIASVPAEVVWLLDEVGLQMSKLNGLLTQLDSRLTQFATTVQQD